MRYPCNRLAPGHYSSSPRGPVNSSLKVLMVTHKTHAACVPLAPGLTCLLLLVLQAWGHKQRALSAGTAHECVGAARGGAGSNRMRRMC